MANATYTNTIGAATLEAYWKDPAFDATQNAFYYIRVIQIPSPRWTAYDQKRYGIKMPDYVPMTGHRPRLHLAHLVHASKVMVIPMKKLAREPLLHFLLLGAAIFLVYSVVSKHSAGEPGKIVITQGQLESLLDGFTQTRQRPPTQDEWEGLIRDRVRQEVLLP